jgi:hypothetical protein
MLHAGNVETGSTHTLIHFPEFMVATHQNHSIGKGHLQAEEQKHNLHLLRPAVDKISIKNVITQLYVTAQAVAGEAMLAKQRQKICQLPVNVSKYL